MDWKFEEVGSLKGKTIIVTGGNSGLGYESVKMFASKDAKIIMASRSKERAIKAINTIRMDFPNADVEFIQLDLTSKKSIRQFVEEFLKTNNRLDILLNNAGVMTTPYMLTEDGLEIQQGVNHFGHFLLTSLLFKVIKSTPNARIVNVSSIAHRVGKMNFDDLLYEKPKSYNKVKAYGRSKLENLLFTYKLASLIKDKGYDIKVLVAHPGVASTNLGRHIKQQKSWNNIIKLFQKLFSHSARDGALSLVRACLDETAESADFFGPNRLFGVKGTPHKAKSSKRSHSDELQTKLWKYSEQILNFDFIV